MSLCQLFLVPSLSQRCFSDGCWEIYTANSDKSVFFFVFGEYHFTQFYLRHVEADVYLGINICDRMSFQMFGELGERGIVSLFQGLIRSHLLLGSVSIGRQRGSLFCNAGRKWRCEVKYFAFNQFVEILMRTCGEIPGEISKNPRAIPSYNNKRNPLRNSKNLYENYYPLLMKN